MSFSIITPIIESDLLKPQFDFLIKSINKQKAEKNTEWLLVGDYSSSLIFKKKKKNIKIKYRFLIRWGNIYQALNYGIKSLKTNFYLFIGADDFFLKKSFKILNEATQEAKKKKYSIIIFETHVKNIIGFFWGGFNLSGGIIINKIIHKKFGFFSEDYNISSDLDFYHRLKKNSFETKYNVHIIKKKICKIGKKGVSSTKYVESILEKIDIERKFKKNNLLIAYIKNFIIYIIILVKKL